MEIQSVRTEEYDAAAGLASVTAVVVRADGSKESIWFRGLPTAVAESATKSANPWLVLLLPAAVALGEDVSTALPADRALVRNLQSLQLIWETWFPGLNRINLQCDTVSDFVRTESQSREKACLFSGGVDSFHVLAEHVGKDRVGDLHLLITVGGFDIPLGRADEFDKVAASATAVAQSINARSVSVETNLRSGSFGLADWGRMSHGCALAGIGLLFQSQIDELFIGSTRTFPNLRRWGSHPVTDPLCSTSAMKVTHFGSTVSRAEKTRILCLLPPALEHLRVCWEQGAAGNCGECVKCIRTMATLHVLGQLKNCITFKNAEFSPQKIKSLHIANPGEIAFFEEIRDLAILRGDRQTRAAIEHALKTSEKKNRRLKVRASILNPLARWMGDKPFFWRISAAIENGSGVN
ncbi:MAG: hypothetical protein AB8B57_12000 [Congregibacter sp.]